jgi:uncharacterized protein YggE
MRYTAIASLLALLISSIAFAADEPPRTVRTSGTASIFVKPDEIELRFEVHTFDVELPKSKSLNDAACKEAVEYLKSLKIEEKDIQAERMRAERVYEEVTNKPREFKGYTVARDYAVVIRDPAAFETVMDWMLPKTQYSIGIFQFRSSESRKHRDQARRNAIRAAREKADLLAGELKCTAGAPRTISEGPEFSGYFQKQSNSNNHDDAGGLAAGGNITPLGQIEIQATVDVTFDLVAAQH